MNRAFCLWEEWRKKLTCETASSKYGRAFSKSPAPASLIAFYCDVEVHGEKGGKLLCWPSLHSIPEKEPAKRGEQKTSRHPEDVLK
jgi:hypothetical protein